MNSPEEVMEALDLIGPIFDAMSDVKKREAKRVSDLESEVKKLLATINHIGK